MEILPTTARGPSTEERIAIAIARVPRSRWSAIAVIAVDGDARVVPAGELRAHLARHDLRDPLRALLRSRRMTGVAAWIVHQDRCELVEIDRRSVRGIWPEESRWRG